MVPNLEKQNLKRDEVKKVVQNPSTVGPELGFSPRQCGSRVYALNGHALLNCRNRISMPISDQRGHRNKDKRSCWEYLGYFFLQRSIVSSKELRLVKKGEDASQLFNRVM